MTWIETVDREAVTLLALGHKIDFDCCPHSWMKTRLGEISESYLIT
jgi:hypothetical protein